MYNISEERKLRLNFDICDENIKRVYILSVYDN